MIQMYFIHITNEHLSGKFLNCQIFTYMVAKNEHLSINHFKAKRDSTRARRRKDKKRNTHRMMYNGQTHNEIIKLLETRAPNGHICVIY